jgi:hypothetical protein
MIVLLRSLAILALLLTLAPPPAFLGQWLTLPMAQLLMLLGTLLWFPCAIALSSR